MVKRCGYFIQDGKLCRKDVYIDWDKGFDREAKHAYIEDIKDKLGCDVYSIYDVTTASPSYKARSLSPFYVKDEDGTNLEDVWAEVKKKTNGVFVPGLYDFTYLSKLSRIHIETALSINCFIDVFHNPDKAINTQAKSLAILKLLHEQNKMYYLEDFKQFSDWYVQNCEVHVVE